jgi:hypothetical protein
LEALQQAIVASAAADRLAHVGNMQIGLDPTKDRQRI